MLRSRDKQLIKLDSLTPIKGTFSADLISAKPSVNRDIAMFPCKEQ